MKGNIVNDELYGNGVLHNVRVLYNCKSNANKMDFSWCNFDNNFRDNCQCNACKCNLNNIYFELRSENAEVRNDIYSYI